MATIEQLEIGQLVVLGNRSWDNYVGYVHRIMKKRVEILLLMKKRKIGCILTICNPEKLQICTLQFIQDYEAMIASYDAHDYAARAFERDVDNFGKDASQFKRLRNMLSRSLEEAPHFLKTLSLKDKGYSIPKYNSLKDHEWRDTWQFLDYIKKRPLA